MRTVSRLFELFHMTNLSNLSCRMYNGFIQRFFCMLIFSMTFTIVNASGIWVGQSITCDASSAAMGLTSDVSWSTSGGYLTLTGSGFYRTVTATQYWGGNATVTCSWKYRLYSGDKWRTQRKTWTFTCSENPVSIYPATMELGVGDKGIVRCSHKYSNNYTSAANVYYSSSNSAIAAVSYDGTITALKQGSCYVTVYSNLSSSANAPSCKVTVKEVNPTSVSLPSSLSICIDENKALTPNVTPSGAQTSFLWKSDNEKVATVDSLGKVLGVNEGSTKIWVKTTVGGFIDYCSVNVSKPNFSINSTSPANNAINQSVLSKLSITYCRAILPSISYSKITLKDEFGNVIQGGCATEGATLTFTPQKALSSKTKYILTVPSSAIKDKYENYNPTYSLAFSTGEKGKLMIYTNNKDNYVTKGSQIQLSANASNANIYYTTDGTSPTTKSNRYNTPISIEKETALKAKAFCDGYEDSDIFEHKYKISKLSVVETYPERNSVVGDYTTISIDYSHRITKGDKFDEIKVVHGGQILKGNLLISGNTLCFIPQKKLEVGTYGLVIPQNSIVKSDDNEPCAKYELLFICDKGNPYPIDYGGRGIMYVIKSDKTLWVWGYYPTENGKRISITNPTEMQGGVIKAAIGDFFIAAIREDGALYCWGENSHGQLGLGHSNYVDTPTKITDNVKCVAANSHTLILKNDGTVWSCGYNYCGQLGNGEKGTTTNASLYKIPIENVDTIAAAFQISAAIKKDGTLWTWGRGGFIGDGGTTDRTSPVKILSDVRNVSICSAGGCAVKYDNTLWEWYGNRAPRKIMDNVSSACCIESNTHVIKTDGDLYSWGYNENGQLGDGKKGNRLWSDYYKVVHVLDDVSKITATGCTTGAMKADGSIWTWGTNDNYSLGYGNADTEQLTPKKLFEGKKIMPINKIRLLKDKLGATIGTKLVSHLILEPLGADYTDIYYTSDDVSIATVDEHGVIDCLRCGNTRINVNVIDLDNNLHVTSCELEVTGEANGIETLKDIISPLIIDYYDTSGKKIKGPKNGVNIIKINNGKSKKVIF